MTSCGLPSQQGQVFLERLSGCEPRLHHEEKELALCRVGRAPYRQAGWGSKLRLQFRAVCPAKARVLTTCFHARFAPYSRPHPSQSLSSATLLGWVPHMVVLRVQPAPWTLGGADDLNSPRSDDISITLPSTALGLSEPSPLALGVAGGPSCASGGEGAPPFA